MYFIFGWIQGHREVNLAISNINQTNEKSRNTIATDVFDSTGILIGLLTMSRTASKTTCVVCEKETNSNGIKGQTLIYNRTFL